MTQPDYLIEKLLEDGLNREEFTVLHAWVSEHPHHLLKLYKQTLVHAKLSNLYMPGLDRPGPNGHTREA